MIVTTQAERSGEKSNKYWNVPSMLLKSSQWRFSNYDIIVDVTTQAEAQWRKVKQIFCNVSSMLLKSSQWRLPKLYKQGWELPSCRTRMGKNKNIDDWFFFIYQNQRNFHNHYHSSSQGQIKRCGDVSLLPSYSSLSYSSSSSLSSPSSS